MPKIEIKEDRCKGCGYCVAACPKGAIKLADTLNAKGIKPAIFSNPSACIGCAFCAVMCPDVCIDVWK